MTNLLEASEQGDLCKVVALLTGGADVKAVDGYGNTPLHSTSWIKITDFPCTTHVRGDIRRWLSCCWL